MRKHGIIWFIQFVLPVIFTTFLFILIIYRFIVPAFHSAVLEKRMDMAKQMTLSALSILINYEEQIQKGELSAEAARTKAIKTIGSIRYGDEMKDYFWITSDHPDMIFHPYRQELNGRYVGEFEDPMGKKLFKEMVEITRAQGAGYVEYQWQKHDDPESVTSKVSYVSLFEPWGWIIGTGVYLEDIEAEISSLSRRLVLITTSILIGVVLIMSFISFRAGKLESEKMTAIEEQMKINNLFQAVFNQTYQLMGILNTDGTVLKVNKKSLDVIGKSQEDVLGRKFWETPWWDHSEKEMGRVRDAVERAAEGEVVRFESHHFRQNGEKVEIDVSFSPILDESGRIQYLLPEGRDVSDQKAAEEQLIKLNDELEKQVKERTGKLNEFLKDLEGTQQQLIQSEKMAALGRLVAGVAHEINTPLGISVTAASYLDDRTRRIKQFLQEDNLTEEEFSTYLDTAIESSGMILTNLERAAGQIKVFKQVAVDQSDEAIRSIILKSYIHEILKSLHPELKKKPCLIDVICPEELEITTYPGTISQIISNLIINSLKHGFKNRDSGTISIECQQKGTHLIMHYQDNGQGIAEGAADKLFEPFYTTARSDGGTGLGLHIVYNLVIQKLKGSITVNTQLETGLGFLIDFPIRKQE